MIPIRLELKNFMSYGENVMPLDLTGVHVACLCGDNGHGKSAILDAITWALWDEARAGSDELIRLGTDEMRVTFDFELNGDLYRVIRGRSKRSSGNVWELHIAENSQSGAPTPNTEHPTPSWRSLTGQGMRDTARQIERTLRMDYRTFINSAYIQQGRADEFTKQTVADRKKILADILDLSRYDALEQKAKDRRTDADQRAAELTREIQQTESELAQEDLWKTQFAEAQKEREGLEAQLAQAEQQVRELEARQADLDAKSKRIKEVEAQIAGLRSELQNLDTQRVDQERRVARGREVLRDKERITDGIARLADTRERIARLDSRLEELRKLEVEKARLEQGIAAEKHRLDADHASAARELSELQTRLESAAAVTKDIESLRAQVAELDAMAARQTALQSELSACADDWGRLKARYEHLGESLKDLQEKFELISQPGAECPLCKTELGHEKHENVIADYKRQIEETETLIGQVKADGVEAKKRRDAAQTEMQTLDKAINDGLAVRNRLAQAEQIVFQADEARKGEPRLRERLGEL